MPGPIEDETGLYPPIEPYETGRLRVDDIHELHFEQCGNPRGRPALFLHGGQGGGVEHLIHGNILGEIPKNFSLFFSKHSADPVNYSSNIGILGK